MSKFTKITLLALAAFLVLGFSITANAAKPDKNHTLTGAPLFGNGVYCAVANMTEEAIAVNWDIYLSDGSKVLDDGYTVDAHAIGGNGTAIPPTAAYCVVSWYGQKGLRGTFCSQQSTGPDVCLKMD